MHRAVTWVLVHVVIFVALAACRSSPPAQVADNGQDGQGERDTDVYTPPDIALPAPDCTKVEAVAVNPLADSQWEFELGPHAVSAVVTSWSNVASLSAIDGLVVNNETWVEPGWRESGDSVLYLRCCVRVAAWPGIATMVMPSSPARVIPEGSWTVSLTSALSTPSVYVRYGEAAGTLQLPIVVHRPQAVPEAEANRYVLDASAILADAANVEVDVVDGQTHSEQALGLSAIGDFPAARDDVRDVLHVVLVPKIDGDTVGVSPVGGPVSGGIVVVEYTTASLPRTLAHELTHFLGLWHLTESAQPDIHDPLPDTPLYDDNNLMSVELFGGVSLSDQQVSIVRRHPILRGALNGCSD